jgi:hypothetical protein
VLCGLPEQPGVHAIQQHLRSGSQFNDRQLLRTDLLVAA